MATNGTFFRFDLFTWGRNPLIFFSKLVICIQKIMDNTYVEQTKIKRRQKDRILRFFLDVKPTTRMLKYMQIFFLLAATA